MSMNGSNSDRKRPGPILDLSSKYLKASDVTALLEQPAFTAYKGVTLESSVLVPDGRGGNISGSVQPLLMRLKDSLQWVNFSKSTVSGRVFYKGIRVKVNDPARDNVSIINKATFNSTISRQEEEAQEYERSQDQEAKSSAHSSLFVVRDDDPPRIHRDDETKEEYYYVRTDYDDSELSFYRSYVLLDWLTNIVELDMTSTNISGYGLTSLAAATANRLQSLKVSRCANVDDRGLYAITNLCSSLRHLDLSYCSNITPFGVIYLSELPADKVQRLQFINLAGCSQINNRVGTALYNALCENDFQGYLRNAEADPSTHEFVTRQGDVNLFPISSIYAQQPSKFWDMTCADITNHVLQRSTENNDFFRLDLSKCLVNDAVLQEVLSKWGPKLHALRLDGTYITLRGLKHLQCCENLRQLSISRCWNILYKSEANRAILPAMGKMHNLKELDISDSRLSGRMLTRKPSQAPLKLTHLIAMRCPISVHAVRLLAETCKDSLQRLSLRGCSFIDAKAIGFISQFSKLQRLDLAHCSSLALADFHALRARQPKFFNTITHLNVTGVKGMDKKACQEYANYLSTLGSRIPPAVIGGGTQHSTASTFRGETPDLSTVYTQLTPGLLKDARMLEASTAPITQKPILRHAATFSNELGSTRPSPSKVHQLPHASSYESLSASDFHEVRKELAATAPDGAKRKSSAASNDELDTSSFPANPVAASPPLNLDAYHRLTPSDVNAQLQAVGRSPVRIAHYPSAPAPRSTPLNARAVSFDPEMRPPILSHFSTEPSPSSTKDTSPALNMNSYLRLDALNMSGDGINSGVQGQLPPAPHVSKPHGKQLHRGQSYSVGQASHTHAVTQDLGRHHKSNSEPALMGGNYTLLNSSVLSDNGIQTPVHTNTSSVIPSNFQPAQLFGNYNLDNSIDASHMSDVKKSPPLHSSVPQSQLKASAKPFVASPATNHSFAALALQAEQDQMMLDDDDDDDDDEDGPH